MFFKLIFIFSILRLISTDEEIFALINPQTGFALDATEDNIKLQKFSGLPPQQWTLEPQRGGKTYIVNRGSGKVLDIDHRWEVKNSYVVVSDKIGLDGNYYNYCPENNSASKGTVNTDACQKWHIHYGGFIVNACGDGTFAVDTRSTNTGVKVETLSLNRGPFQKFEFKYL